MKTESTTVGVAVGVHDGTVIRAATIPNGFCIVTIETLTAQSAVNVVADSAEIMLGLLAKIVEEVKAS